MNSNETRTSPRKRDHNALTCTWPKSIQLKKIQERRENTERSSSHLILENNYPNYSPKVLEEQEMMDLIEEGHRPVQSQEKINLVTKGSCMQVTCPGTTGKGNQQSHLTKAVPKQPILSKNLTKTSSQSNFTFDLSAPGAL